MAKRGSGEGSISRRKDGRWMAQISLGNDLATGKPKRRTFYGKTRQEVAEKLRKALADFKEGGFIDTGKMTVEVWFRKWLDIYSKPKVRISTWESYNSVFRRHIAPTIGHLLLKDLRPEHLQQLYNDKLANGRVDGKGGLSATTVSYIHAVLHQGFKQAVLEQLVFRNVAESVNKPKKKRHEVTPLTIDEVNTLLTTAREDRLFPALLVEWGTGLRRGELLGLKWPDVDLKRGQVMVRQSLIRTRQGLIFSEPKTPKSRRTIPLPAEVTTELRRHKKAQAEEKLLFGQDYGKDNLVFCNPDGRPYDPRWFTRQFERLLQVAGLPRITFHDMRHSHATMLLVLKENTKVVAERLGHSTVAMTLDTYSHIIPGMQEQAAAKLNSVLDIKKEPSKKNG